jgi:hypothetical protein
MTLTLKALITKIATDLFDAGVDVGIILAAKDADVDQKLKDCGCAGNAKKEEDTVFVVFEGNSRETWEMKARAGAIAHIFNQEVDLVGK